MQEMIISALIGLNGAENNHGAMEEPDRLILEGLSECCDQITVERAEELVRAIHRAKCLVAPDCSSCLNRCGNTDDYDMSEYRDGNPETKEWKTKMITEASAAAKRLREKGEKRVPRDLHTALSYFKFDYPAEYYEKLIESLKQIG